jgi:molybdate transport system ATP-binding protein
MTVDLDCTIDRGDFRLELATVLEPGTVVAVLGPNGAGKSTLLRAIAGLQPIERGRIEIGGRLVDDGSTTFVAPRERSVGVVFQDYALFPHLDVLDNVAFGPRSRGAGRARARELARDQLGRLGIGDLADRRPAAISGGPAQRVALARALAPSPDVLLLDEPMAALDAETREGVRVELETQLSAFAGCTVLVTHEPLDAMLLADRVLVIEGGRIVQEGEPAQLASRPLTDYVARLMGVTLLRGTADAGAVQLDSGGVLHAADHGVGGRALAVVRPESVTIHRHRPEGSARNVWPAVVASLQPAHDRVRVALDGQPSVVAAVTPAAVAELGLARGTSVWLSVKAVDVDVYATPTR